MTDQNDHLAQMLAEGWSIEGYSNTLMAAGAMTYSVLLRKNDSLTAVTIGVNGGREIGRNVVQLSPMPAATPKKGFFS